MLGLDCLSCLTVSLQLVNAAGAIDLIVRVGQALCMKYLLFMIWMCAINAQVAIGKKGRRLGDPRAKT